MRKSVVSVKNGLLAEAIIQMLGDSDDFQPFRLSVNSKTNDIVERCRTLEADMLIAEVSYASGTNVALRLAEAKELSEVVPKCKIVFLCDENSAPDIAREVMLAKKDGRIDAFFYSSVTAKYLLAALTAL